MCINTSASERNVNPELGYIKSVSESYEAYFLNKSLDIRIYVTRFGCLGVDCGDADVEFIFTETKSVLRFPSS